MNEVNLYVMGALAAAALSGLGGCSTTADWALGLAFFFWVFSEE